jgi:hypothetical protein
MLSTQLPRFNAKWRDPQCEDADFLHLPDAAWRHENNYCNPPLDCSPDARRQTPPVRRTCNRSGPLLAQQTLVPRPTAARVTDATLPPRKGRFLPRQARQARGGRTTRLEHRGSSSNTPA